VTPYATRKMLYPTKADRKVVFEAAQLASEHRKSYELEVALKLLLEKMGGPP
jgi:hypothetical protein